MQDGNTMGMYGRVHVQFLTFYRELVKAKDPQAHFDDKASASRAYGALEMSDNNGTVSWKLTVSGRACCIFLLLYGTNGWIVL